MLPPQTKDLEMGDFIGLEGVFGWRSTFLADTNQNTKEQFDELLAKLKAEPTLMVPGGMAMNFEDVRVRHVGPEMRIRSLAQGPREFENVRGIVGLTIMDWDLDCFNTNIFGELHLNDAGAEKIMEERVIDASRNRRGNI